MIHASAVHPLSLQGRYAYALACLQSLCDHFELMGGFIRAQIEAHCDAMSVRHLCHWFDSHPYPEQYEVFTATVGPGQLSGDQLHSVFHAFGYTREIICGSCYSSLKDLESMFALLNVVGVLCRWGAALPDLDRFLVATWSGSFETDGGGERLTRADFGI